MNYDQAFSVSTQKLGLIVDNSRNSLRISFVTVIIAIFISIVLILFFSFVIASAITKPITKLENYAKNIESTDILEVINTQSKDEVGSLAKSFGNMVLQLRKSKTDVEETVKERTKDLEKLNQYLTGRELKMIELKEEIKKLKEKK
jgi:nitrate/nitrite-specific signal transduction histidine kinase